MSPIQVEYFFISKCVFPILTLITYFIPHRCLDTSGGYLFHDPERAGRVIEACVCLHNCAKVAKLKILKDFPSKDGFRVCRTAVVQPKQVGVKPKLKFANLRKDFIDTYFKPKANAVWASHSEKQEKHSYTTCKRWLYLSRHVQKTCIYYITFFHYYITDANLFKYQMYILLYMFFSTSASHAKYFLLLRWKGIEIE